MNCPFCKSHLIAEGYNIYTVWYCRNCSTSFYLMSETESYYTIVVEKDKYIAYFDCYPQLNISWITIGKYFEEPIESSKLYSPKEAEQKLKVILPFV